jgi:CheY-like chemotaxis protein
MIGLVSSGRATALVVHADGELLDLLIRLFEANGFDVVTALSTFRAQAHLEGERPIDVVIAPWEPGQEIGGEVYAWVLAHRPDLRSQFVFIADEIPPGFDLVGGRCLSAPLAAEGELVRIARTVVRRLRTPAGGVPVVAPGRPSLLLVDDDPVLLVAMAGLLGDSGYAVWQAGGTHAAMASLEERDFDAIVADWRLHDGSGALIYAWIDDHKPALASRVVFLAEADGDGAGPLAPDRPTLRKGQDSQALLEVLRQIVRQARG